MSNRMEKMLQRRPIVDAEFSDLYEKLTLMPHNFNKKDPRRIKVFAERLRNSRESVTKRNKDIQYRNGHDTEGPRYCNITTQDQVAKWLGITPARVSQIESGKIREIPMDYLIAFYDMFDVTPHYLLGYTDSPDETLAVLKEDFLVDKNGNCTKLTVRREQLPFDADGNCLVKVVRKNVLQTDKNGNYLVAKFPMTHPILSQKKSMDILSVLAWSKMDWFITLCRFLRADNHTLETGFKILDVLLETTKSTNSKVD